MTLRTVLGTFTTALLLVCAAGLVVSYCACAHAQPVATACAHPVSVCFVQPSGDTRCTPTCPSSEMDP